MRTEAEIRAKSEELYAHESDENADFNDCRSMQDVLEWVLGEIDELDVAGL